MSSPLLQWTPQRIAKALALRADGLSATQIGQRMGVTRNAVLGALFRNAHPELRTVRIAKTKAVRERFPVERGVWSAWGLESSHELRRAIWAKARKGARAAMKAEETVNG